MIAALLAAASLAATPVFGLEWTPLSRGDLVWVADGRTTGLGVGEFDGTVRPALSAFGGAWVSRRVGLVGSLGVARLTSTATTAETWRARHWGVVRPAVDVRFALIPRDDPRPSPWVFLGAYGDIPSARDTSNGYSDEEEEEADQTAYAERARLGGFGGRAGVGVDVRLHPYLSLGALWAVQVHRGTLITSETHTVTAWVGGHASLLLTFDWPRTPSEGP